MKKKLYFRSGTICHKDPTWTIILDTDNFLHWIEATNRLTNLGTNKCVWIIYSRDKMDRKVESILPFEQATQEQLLNDFEIEDKLTKPTSDSKTSKHRIR